MRLFLRALLLCAAGALAHAQSISWDPPGGSIGLGQTTQLRLVCRDCEPDAPPPPPKVPDLRIEYQGERSDYSSVNGSATRSITFIYAVRWSEPEPLVIPAFDVATDHGPVQVAEVRFDPAQATVGNTGKPLDSAANARLELPQGPVWEGQVFPIDYIIQADAVYRPDFAHSPPQWNPTALVVEDWSAPRAFEGHAQGGVQTCLEYRTRAIAPRPGSFTLPAVSQLVNLSVGLAMFGFYENPQFQEFAVPSNRPLLLVRRRPPAPAGFSGAVGQFELRSKVVPQTADVREPVTWTLELSGTGNWPHIRGLPARSVSRDFTVIHPQLQRFPAPGKLFDGRISEDVVLVPTRPGHYVLPAVRFVYFDPAAGEYRTLATPEANLEITGAPQAAAPVPPGAAGESAGAGPAAAALPQALPHDPLPTGASGSSPLATGEWIAAALVPFLLPFIVWLALAWRRAIAWDPGRPQREARLRLARTLSEISSASATSAAGDDEAGAEGGAGRARAFAPWLLAWQRDAALLWRVRHAAPAAAAMTDPRWKRLWEESEAALYGPAGELPPDWAKRASEALQASPMPRFRLRRIFSPRNLLPFVAAALALAPLRGDGLSSYRAGDYPAAAAAWRDAPPLDAAARYDLSLALAQQGRWPDAAAQAAAAFVQRPESDSIRGQFSLCCARAGIVPGGLSSLLQGQGFDRLAARASPPWWQRAAIAGGLLFATALTLALACSYRPDLLKSGPDRAGITMPVFAAVLLAAGLVAGGVGAAGWLAYGEAAHPDAVWVLHSGLLRSIPTDVETSQLSEPLAAGTIGRLDGEFLSWRRLRFANGTTGWVRSSDLVPLYTW